MPKRGSAEAAGLDLVAANALRLWSCGAVRPLWFPPASPWHCPRLRGAGPASLRLAAKNGITVLNSPGPLIPTTAVKFGDSH